MAKYLLGLDNGSTMIKASVFDLEGVEKGTFSTLAEPFSPAPGWYERDMAEVWRANAQAIRGALAQAGASPADVLGVSVTGHGNGAYLVDREGRAVRNAVIGTDSRALPYLAGFEAMGYYEKFHARTMQTLWPGMSLLVLAWLRDHEPQAYARTHSCFSVVDYIRFMLTGQRRSELSCATSTGLLNAAEQRVDRGLLAEMGMEEAAGKLPPLVASFDPAGTVDAKGAADTGLAQGTPVFGGCFDVDAAALATGTVDESLITVISGTWANNQYIGREPVVSRDLFSTTAFARPGYYLMLEGSPTSASNLEWFVREFLRTERKQAKAEGRSVYDLCNQAVEETGAEEAGLVFLPYLFGSNTNPLAQGCLLGLQGWHERRHIIRAIYEGICFSHRYHIEKLLRRLPAPAAARMSGGGARSRVWTQMFADVLQLPMEIPAATELGTLGAAMCAGIGAGAFRDAEEAVGRMVRVDRRVEPDPGKKAVYDRKYQRWLQAIQALDPFWQ